MKQTRVLLAIGSNQHQQRNMATAKRLLETLLDNPCFTRMVWTAPINVDSDMFANMLATGTTILSLPALQKQCKKIEASLGDKDGNHAQGIVNIDIDVLQYGTQRHHVEDWSRDYVKTLMGELQGNATTLTSTNRKVR